MPLYELRLLSTAETPAKEVWLTCSDGTTTYIISIHRGVLENFAGQGTKEAQDDVVQRNLGNLASVIEAKIERGGFAGKKMPKVELTRADLDQGLKQRQVISDAGFGGASGSVSSTPPPPQVTLPGESILGSAPWVSRIGAPENLPPKWRVFFIFPQSVWGNSSWNAAIDGALADV